MTPPRKRNSNDPRSRSAEASQPSSVRRQRRREPFGLAHVLWWAKRSGFAFAGALGGSLAAAALPSASVPILDPAGMAAAFMIFGWLGSFLGAAVDTAGPPACKGPHRSEWLSAGGTLVANPTALLAAWFLLSDFQPGTAWMNTLAVCWLIGVAQQITAGALAHLRAVDPGIDAPPLTPA